MKICDLSKKNSRAHQGRTHVACSGFSTTCHLKFLKTCELSRKLFLTFFVCSSINFATFGA